MDEERPPERPARKPPGPVTPAYLERAAMAYLERYASSSANLARVLRRKVQTRCRLRGEDPQEALGLVDEVVRKALRTGLVDDARYAEGRVASLRRRGGSARAIRAKLAAKGLDRELVEGALGEDPTDDEAAAHAFARRRRLGPYRPGQREPHRDRDLAAMGRGGFSFDLARRVVDGERAE